MTAMKEIIRVTPVDDAAVKLRSDIHRLGAMLDVSLHENKQWRAAAAEVCKYELTGRGGVVDAINRLRRLVAD
jgi:hypothetical protein